MTRDMDLIRELLLKLEALPTRPGAILVITPDGDEIAIPGYDAAQIAYHLSQICSAGFIDDGDFRPVAGGTGFRSLTWDGHDFLDSVRDPKIWHATKEGAKQAGGFSLDLLKALAKGLIKKKIEEHTGVQRDL